MNIGVMMNDPGEDYVYVWCVWKNAKEAYFKPPIAWSESLEELHALKVKGIYGRSWIKKGTKNEKKSRKEKQNR
jgi:hypothetical protein